MHAPRIQIQIGDLSKAIEVRVKRGDQDIRAWSVIWYPVASDGKYPVASDGTPTTLQQVQLGGRLADRVAALSLHQYDLSFCDRILKEYGSRFVGDNDLLLALWTAVLTKFMSCFQDSKARRKLDPRQVYGSNPKALKDFNLLMALRNKHIVHDENSHYQAAAFAWLEPDGQVDVREVGPLICAARVDPTLVASMGNLVKGALEYTQIAISNAGVALLVEVQAMTPAERSALPKSVSFPLPTSDDVTKIR
jgi:hypothetical protein